MLTLDTLQRIADRAPGATGLAEGAPPAPDRAPIGGRPAGPPAHGAAAAIAALFGVAIREGARYPAS